VCREVKVCIGTQVPRVDKLMRDSDQHSCKRKETLQVLVDRDNARSAQRKTFKCQSLGGILLKG
jgi:hypothetical protein